MDLRVVAIGGAYHRVADPEWADPLDDGYAAAAPGRRWNPTGLPCLYLNADEGTARAYVDQLFAGRPYGPHDLDPTTAPVLVDVTVPDGEAVDAYTDDGLSALGLPTTYPADGSGGVVPHGECQPLGQAAFDADLDGVDARSAAPGGTRELAWFARGRTLTPDLIRPFNEWY